MANNREERRAGKDWMTPEQRIIKRSFIKDNFLIFLLIITIFTNVTLSYSIINLNTNVTNFMADIFYNTPVNTDVAAESVPHIHGKDGVEIPLTKDEEGKWYYLNEGKPVYPPEEDIEFPVVNQAETPQGEYIDPSQINTEPSAPHIHGPNGTIELQKDAEGKYFYIDDKGKKVYPGTDEIH